MLKVIWRIVALLLIYAGVVVSPASAKARSDETFDAYVERLMRTWPVPGMAVAIIKDGKVVHLRGYGVRSIDRPGAVDADTLFRINSMTKSMAALLVATHVDEGNIGWNDQLMDHLPWFQTGDPGLTRDLRIDDVLSHRSGLNAKDWLEDTPGRTWEASLRTIQHL